MSIETTYATPGNLLMKIESLSSFSKCGIDKFKSGAFESGGYKWLVSLLLFSRHIFTLFVTIIDLF